MKNITKNTALEAGAHSTALECYDQTNFRTAVTEDGSIQYMPGGLHTITPTQGGRPVTVTVMVDEDSAAAIEQERQEIVARNKSPYFSITHENQIAGFRPTKFYWAARPDVTGKLSEGVWADGEWTASGVAARDGKDFKFFSPTFHVSSTTDNPATVVCQPLANVVMGSLVNDPAFDKISPLFAGDATTLEAGGRGSGMVSYATASDKATVSDLAASLATRRAVEKASPAAHRAACDAHNDAITCHTAAGNLGGSVGQKLLHDTLAKFHTDMSGFHAGYDDSNEGLTDASTRSDDDLDGKNAKTTDAVNASNPEGVNQYSKDGDAAEEKSKKAMDATKQYQSRPAKLRYRQEKTNAVTAHEDAADAHWNAEQSANEAGKTDEAAAHNEKAIFHSRAASSIRRNTDVNMKHTPFSGVESKNGDTSSQHEELMAIEPFAQAHDAAIQAATAVFVAMNGTAPAAHLATLADIESEAWKNIADWAERNGFLLAGQGYRESQQLAEHYSIICREQRPRR